jgi:hypothetical protein
MQMNDIEYPSLWDCSYALGIDNRHILVDDAGKHRP